MRKLICILVLLFAASSFAADRVTLTVTITNTPSDGNTLVVNSSTRTWKTSPTAAQILIGASIGANATNLYNHSAANSYVGPLILQRNGTNAINLVGQVGQALTASMVGTWGTVSFSTQTVQTASIVRVPITIEPTASAQTNIASLVVSNVFNLGLSTNAILAASSVMANFVDTSEAQTVAGIKTFSSETIHSGSLTMLAGTTMQLATNANFVLQEGAKIAIATNVSVLDSLLVDRWRFNSVEQTNSITVFSDLTNKINARITGENSWTGTNTFTRITNSTIVNSVLSGNNTISGTVGTFTNGTWTTPTLNSAVNRVAAFQSYINTASNLELGNGAVVTNTFVNALAIGQDAKAGADESIAIGQIAAAKYEASVALGASAATTAINQIRLGTAAEQVSVPGSAAIAGNLSIGHSDSPTFPASMAKGLYLTNGTAATSDPANGAGVWVLSGELQYRTSGTTEGNGGTQRVHNRAAQVTGAGSDYTLTGAYALLNFGGQTAAITLPTAGTYLVTGVVELLENAAGGNDLYYVRLYDNTAAAAIASSERYLSHFPASKYGQVTLSNVITVSALSVIQIQSYNATAARGTAVAAATSISYVRLY